MNLPPVPTDEAAPDTLDANDWARMVTDHLQQTFLVCQAAGRRMLAQNAGVIINITSTDAARPGSRVARSTAMAGVDALTYALGVAWASRGVRVVGVAQHLPYTERTIPLGSCPTPQEVAQAVVFLASEAARFVVAEVLPVDGGFSAYGLF